MVRVLSMKNLGPGCSRRDKGAPSGFHVPDFMGIGDGKSRSGGLDDSYQRSLRMSGAITTVHPSELIGESPDPAVRAVMEKARIAGARLRMLSGDPKPGDEELLGFR